jgi:hypothetical protein
MEMGLTTLGEYPHSDSLKRYEFRFSTEGAFKFFILRILIHDGMEK